MSTTIHDDHQEDQLAHPKHKHRDEYEHLETLDHLGLVRDLEETLTPIDVLFNPKECSKPHGEPRHYI